MRFVRLSESGVTLALFLATMAAFSVLSSAALAAETLSVTVSSGKKSRIYWSGQVNPVTCKVEDTINYRRDIVRTPAHGSLSTGHEETPFRSAAGAHPCNGRPFLANILYYQSAKGFKGIDEFVIRRSSLAHFREMTTELTVKVKVD